MVLSKAPTPGKTMHSASRTSFMSVTSFRGCPDEDITVGTTDYDGTDIPTFFRKANVYGTQFHPEKSSASGMRFLENFISFAGSVL